MKQYTISVSEISPDGTTMCSTWLTESEVAALIQQALTGRYGPAPTQQMFSANAINDAAESMPIVQL